jgi:hypothetical protein
MSNYGSILKITKKKGKFILFENKNYARRVADEVEKWDFADGLMKTFQCKRMKIGNKNEVYLLKSTTTEGVVSTAKIIFE